MQETIADFAVFHYHTIIQKKEKALNKRGNKKTRAQLLSDTT